MTEGEASTVACVECGGQFAEPETIVLSGRRVCAACKPVLLQRVTEGAALGDALTYAGFWSRALAAVLDWFLLLAANTVIQLVATPLLLRSGSDPLGMLPVLGALYAAQLSIAISYETWFIGRTGATPGKMAARVRVVRADGSSLTYPRALGRYFAKILSSATLGIGFFMVVFDEEKRALHDRLCDTRVVLVS